MKRSWCMCLEAFNSPLSSSCSHGMGQHMVTSTKKHTLTSLPVGIPWESCQKASKIRSEDSLCDATSATGKLEWYRHSWEIQSLCNVPEVCFWGADRARTPLFPFVLACRVFLLWEKPSKPHTQMCTINAYVLKMKEGTTRGDSTTWCDSRALEEKQTSQNGWKEMGTETYHSGERELNLNEKTWKLLKKYKRFSAF